MTRLWADGFDMYSSMSDFATRYDSVSATANASLGAIATTPFNSGQTLVAPGSVFNCTKTWETATNETTIYFSLRLKMAGSTTPLYISLCDTATAQVTIMWNGDGSVSVRSGGTAGTVLATYSGIQPLNMWESWQGKVVINNTTGSVELRKNGDINDLTTLSNVNTRGGTTNAYANAMIFGWTGTSGNWTIDDLWFNSSAGTSVNAWPSDVRLLWQPVTADVTTVFAQGGYPIRGRTGTATGSTYSEVATTIAFSQFTSVGTRISSVSVTFVGAIVGNAKIAIYSDAAGNPANLLATTNELVNPVVGLNVLSFASPLTLTYGTNYWAAIITSVASSLVQNSTTTSNLGAQITGTTYAAAFPSTASASLTSRLVWFQPNYTTNSSYVSDVQADGDTSYVSAFTVSAKDIYSGVGLGSTLVSSIVGVYALAMWKRSDTGARTATLGVDANGSGDTAQVSGVTPGTTYGYSGKFLATDPTGAAWTTGNLTTAKISVTVAS